MVSILKRFPEFLCLEKSLLLTKFTSLVAFIIFLSHHRRLQKSRFRRILKVVAVTLTIKCFKVLRNMWHIFVKQDTSCKGIRHLENTSPLPQNTVIKVTTSTGPLDVYSVHDQCVLSHGKVHYVIDTSSSAKKNKRPLMVLIHGFTGSAYYFHVRFPHEFQFFSLL